MTSMQNVSRMLILTLFVGISGCSTVSPDRVVGRVAGFDDSAPSQYPRDTNGYLYFVKDSEGMTVGAYITENKKAHYNALIDAYALQHQELYHYKPVHDDGVGNAKDKFGNAVYFITDEKLTILLRFQHWENDQRPNDTWWMKIKDNL